MNLKYTIKFDDKKMKSAMMRQAEKLVAEKVSEQMSDAPQRVEIVCKHCRAKFFAPIGSGICPHCRKFLN